MHAAFDLHLLDTRQDVRVDPRVTAKSEGAPEEAGEEPIVCAACGERITDRKERVAPDGSHEHTFVNPAGVIYRIACFRSAPGCSEAGDSTEDWSWFPGYLWRYAFCGSCAEHLGWVYRSGSGDAFWGLIAARLAEGRG